MFEPHGMNLRRNRKRTFNQMISQERTTESTANTQIIWTDLFVNKKKKIDSSKEVLDPITLQKEMEILNKIQKDLKNLQLKNLLTPTVNDIDMPEIVDIPLIQNNSYYVDEEADTINTSAASIMSHEHKINEKLIDNAIKTERTMMKYYEELHLQPNASNGIILYKDMKKIKNKMDNNFLANCIVKSYNEGKHKKGSGMDIDAIESSLVIDNLQKENSNIQFSIEEEFESIVNNNEFFYYDMYLD